MSGWTQPMCDHCWVRRNGERPPVRTVGERERCAFCGFPTSSGIYVRADPAEVPYP